MNDHACWYLQIQVIQSDEVHIITGLWTQHFCLQCKFQYLINCILKYVAKIPGYVLNVIRDRSLFMTGGRGTGVNWLFVRNFFTAYYARGGKKSCPTQHSAKNFRCLKLNYTLIQVFSRLKSHKIHQMKICSVLGKEMQLSITYHQRHAPVKFDWRKTFGSCPDLSSLIGVTSCRCVT